MKRISLILFFWYVCLGFQPVAGPYEELKECRIKAAIMSFDGHRYVCLQDPQPPPVR